MPLTNDVRRTYSSSPAKQNYTLLLSTRSYHRTPIRESAWHNKNCTNWQVTKMLKQASYVSQVTEFKWDTNINDVLVEFSASHLTPSSVYVGRYVLWVRRDSVQTHLQKAKWLSARQWTVPVLHIVTAARYAWYRVRTHAAHADKDTPIFDKIQGYS